MITRGPGGAQPRSSYNVAPTYIEQVYRAVDASSGTGYESFDPGEVDDAGVVEDGTEYILQSMKWGTRYTKPSSPTSLGRIETDL